MRPGPGPNAPGKIEGAERRFLAGLALVLLFGLILRLAYLLAQPAVDPWFAHPTLDGAYYLDWGLALTGQGEAPSGAFYLAPLYPYLLAAFLFLFAKNYLLLYLLQHLASLATAVLVAVLGRRAAGNWAGLFAALLFVSYHPLIFFASRPLGETLAILLMTAALAAATRARPLCSSVSGACAGLAALARPNLILLPAAWAALRLLGRSPRAAMLLVLGTAAVVLPVTLRNLVVAGHPVLISSNGGITAYHGNGPGARGVFTLPDGFSGGLERQREEATLQARQRSGNELDDVEADRWWGRQALDRRLEDPGGTLRLLWARVRLLLEAHEHGLGSSPMLDRNPWRLTWRVDREVPVVSFSLLFALACAGWIAAGARGSGGRLIWTGLLACALTPLLFYASSRYRLPTAALLVIPAGCGFAALLGLAKSRAPRRRVVAAITAIALVGLLTWVPSPCDGFRAEELSSELANRSLAFLRLGNRAEAEQVAREGLALAPLHTARLRFALGRLRETEGNPAAAETEYRAALRQSPGLAEAAVNLSSILFRRGAYQEAIDPLRRALESRPSCEDCWTNLVSLLLAAGDGAAAVRAVEQARQAGIMLDPGLVRLMEQAPATRDREEEE